MAWRTFYDAYFDRLWRYLLVVAAGNEDAARAARDELDARIGPLHHLAELARGQQHAPRRLHLDGEVPRVVGRQSVLAVDPHEALVRARLEPAEMKLHRPHLAGRRVDVDWSAEF